MTYSLAYAQTPQKSEGSAHVRLHHTYNNSSAVLLRAGPKLQRKDLKKVFPQDSTVLPCQYKFASSEKDKHRWHNGGGEHSSAITD